MEKILIHTLTINAKLAKDLFQIVLPENTTAITGIAVMSDLYKIPSVQIGDIGKIRLHVADTGDKFFSQVLQAFHYTPNFQMYGMIDEQYYSTTVGQKKHFEMQDTFQPTQSTLIEGYYEDIAGTKLSDAFIYHVRIYLRVKITQA